MSSRSLTCAAPAARERTPVALCTSSQSSLLSPFRNLCIQSGQSAFVSLTAFFQQSSKQLSPPRAEEWMRRRAANPTSKHVTCRQDCGRGCQTSAVFPSLWTDTRGRFGRTHGGGGEREGLNGHATPPQHHERTQPPTQPQPQPRPTTQGHTVEGNGVGGVTTEKPTGHCLNVFVV